MRKKMLLMTPLLALVLAGCGPNLEPEGIDITNTDTFMLVGGELQLATAILPEGHRPVALDFESSNDEVATVAPSGLVTAVSPGPVTFTVTIDGTEINDTHTLQVVEPVEIEEIAITNTETVLHRGGQLQLDVDVTPSVPATSLYFLSSDTDVASVTTDGLVTAHVLGEVVFTVGVIGSDKTDTLEIEVVTAASLIEQVNILTDAELMIAGSTLELEVEVLPEVLAGEIDLVFDSSDDAVASVNGEGLVTAHAVGEVRISVELEDGNASDYIDLEVTDAMHLWEESLEIDYSNLTMDVFAVTEDGASQEYYMEKLLNGYTVAIHPNPEAYSELFYHDYEGESRLYFEDEGNGEAWLKEGYHNSPLGLENTYFSLPIMLEELAKLDADADLYVDYGGGLVAYSIDDADIMECMNMTALSSFWYNGMFFAMAIIIDIASAEIVAIQAFDENSVNDVAVIELYDIGNTGYNGTLPAAPTAETARTYADYTDTDPWTQVDVEGVSVALPDGADAFLDRGEELELDVIYDPVDANNGVQMMLDWFTSDPEVVEINEVTGVMRALNEGTAEIWCETFNGHVSNKITITVNPLPEPALEGLVHDLTFNDIDGNGVIDFDDAVAGAKPITMASSGVSTNDAERGGLDKYPSDKQALLLDPQVRSDISIATGEELITGISFNISLFWGSQDVPNKSRLVAFEIQTSDDGEVWDTAADLTQLMKDTATKDSIVLIEETFEPTSHVRIYSEINMLGSNRFRLATDNICLYSDIAAPMPEEIIGIWRGQEIYGLDAEVTIDAAGNLHYIGGNMESVEVEFDAVYDGVDDFGDCIFVDADGSLTSITMNDDGTINIFTDNHGVVVAQDLVLYVPPVIIDVAEIQLSGVSTSLAVGQTDQLSANVLPGNATNKVVTYHVSAPDIVTVSSTGVVTAVGEGTVEVTAKSADGQITSNAVTYIVSPAAEVLSGPIIGEWYCDLEQSLFFTEVTVIITADGSLSLVVDYIGYDEENCEFIFVSEADGVYTFENAEGSIATCELADNDTLYFYWVDSPDGEVYMDDGTAPLIREN